MKFSDFNLDQKLMECIQDLTFETPTPIQEEAIPLIHANNDVVGLAQTGTGKTAAYALPILQALLNTPPGPIQTLVLVPTRELADQVCDEFMALGRKTSLRCTTLYGGVNINPQISRLQMGVDIVIACPGRLLDHMERGTIDLTSVSKLVLDEADRLFDMGFIPDVRKIISQLPKQRQTLLFSATMSDDIRQLVNDILHRPRTVEIAANAPTPTVTHVLFPVKENRKAELLIEILYLEQKYTRSVLIFTRTKHRAREVTKWLQSYGHKVALLEGDLTQFRRSNAIQGFRDGTFQILVATDIAARGIDVAGISHVINYDMPDNAEAYIHRIGRTGRIQESGVAYTFATPRDKTAVQALDRMLKGKMERRILEQFGA
ncbi:MAG: DEAD/DEAH box helicase [Anaerolineae bacterium]|nr:DEAD/DEAH box helicase [Anaerolineae bacterium]